MAEDKSALACKDHTDNSLHKCMKHPFNDLFLGQVAGHPRVDAP